MPSRGRAGPRQRVLVVNDDGIDAPGLRAVVVALAARFDVYVCAPAVEKSASSHAISIHAPVSAEPRVVPGAARAFACGGGATPADCAMLALDVLFADDGDARAFDVVVSGTLSYSEAVQFVWYAQTRSCVALGTRVSYCRAPQILTVLHPLWPSSSCHSVTPLHAGQRARPGCGPLRPTGHKSHTGL